MTQALVQFNPTDAQLEIIRRTVAKDTTQEQFRLFVEVCKFSGLNPFARQIYAVVRQNQMTIQTSIDGYRLLAERSGKYAGQIGPQWCGKDGKWLDVWLDDAPPAAARIGIIRRDFDQPIWGVAKYKSYVQESSPTWRKMPDVMLAKCAEALALRKAFPAEMSGIYTKEEMEQADSDALPTMPVPAAHNGHAPVASVRVVEGDPAQPPADVQAAPESSTKPLTYIDALNTAIKLHVCKNKADFTAFVSATMGINGENLTQEQLATLMQGIEQAAQAAAQPQASAA